MRDFVRRLRSHWVITWLLLWGALLGVYWLAEWIFGPYGHWTLWVRVPLVTVIFVVWFRVAVVSPRRRRRRRTRDSTQPLGGSGV